MSKNEQLLACYRSGQMSEAQLYLHQKDAAFRTWFEGRKK